MNPITIQTVSKKKFVKISFNVQNKLEDLNIKLKETENMLKTKENENMDLCKTLAMLENRLSSAEEVQKILREENEQLKSEFKTNAISLNHNTTIDFDKKCDASNAEYQILSNQLDLLEEDISELTYKNKEMLTKIESLQKSLAEVCLSKEKTQYNLGKANEQIKELQNFASLLEYEAETTSTQNLDLQKSINQVINQSKKELECTKVKKSEPTNSEKESFKGCSKTKTEAACHQQLADGTAETDNDNIDNNSIITYNPHRNIYYDLAMKSADFPCKSGKDFEEQIDLRANMLNKQLNKVGGRDSRRGGLNASKFELKANVASFHKKLNLTAVPNKLT